MAVRLRIYHGRAASANIFTTPYSGPASHGGHCRYAGVGLLLSGCSGCQAVHDDAGDQVPD